MDGRVLTAGEHQQVLDSIIEGLGVHARDCEEVNNLNAAFISFFDALHLNIYSSKRTERA